MSGAQDDQVIETFASDVSDAIDYTRSHVATDSEANEIVRQATEFYDFVETWIDASFPNLRR